MVKVRLIDYFGFTIGRPKVPSPLPKVVVWGEEFFLRNDDDVQQGDESPRYHMTTGFVVSETKEHAVI